MNHRPPKLLRNYPINSTVTVRGHHSIPNESTGVILRHSRTSIVIRMHDGSLQVFARGDWPKIVLTQHEQPALL